MIGLVLAIYISCVESSASHCTNSKKYSIAHFNSGKWERYFFLCSITVQLALRELIALFNILYALDFWWIDIIYFIFGYILNHLCVV